jgi:hypothetical protein
MKVLSARFGSKKNSLDSGVVIETDDLGSVATSTKDARFSGGAWEALQAWLSAGNTISAYVAKPEGTKS